MICGDWNIAHRNIDLKNWKSNQKNSGFLPHERAWLDLLFGDAKDRLGRCLPQPAPGRTKARPTPGGRNRGQAWANNVGWRIDYQIITPGLREQAQAASVYKDERFSDHAPLTIDYAD